MADTEPTVGSKEVAAVTRSGEGYDPRGVFENETDRRSAIRFGMWLLYAALGMLFGAVIILLVLLRFEEKSWPTDLPPLPWQLWLSTGLLLVESVVLIAAQRASSPAQTQRWLIMAFSVAVLFMASQGWAVWVWHTQVDEQARRIAVTALYVTSGVHVLHVLGGLVPLGLLLWYPRTRHSTNRGEGLLMHTASYWHFLDGVWLALVVTLLIVL
jgi:cytochrome c oxidase subunit 3